MCRRSMANTLTVQACSIYFILISRKMSPLPEQRRDDHRRHRTNSRMRTKRPIVQTVIFFVSRLLVCLVTLDYVYRWVLQAVVADGYHCQLFNRHTEAQFCSVYFNRIVVSITGHFYYRVKKRNRIGSFEKNLCRTETENAYMVPRIYFIVRCLPPTCMQRMKEL